MPKSEHRRCNQTHLAFVHAAGAGGDVRRAPGSAPLLPVRLTGQPLLAHQRARVFKRQKRVARFLQPLTVPDTFDAELEISVPGLETSKQSNLKAKSHTAPPPSKANLERGV